MNTHTITLAESIEPGIQKVQIDLMKYWQRDVPFTEAVNYLLLDGLSVWGETNMTSDEFEIWIEHWMAGIYETAIPGFNDSIENWKRNNAPKFPSRRSDKWFSRTKNKLNDSVVAEI
jgi:hypothetical protein